VSDPVDRAVRLIRAKVLPPPTAPHQVAQAYASSERTDPDGLLLLRSHRGDFHAWSGSCWPAVEARGVREALYAHLADATYEAENAKGGAEVKAWSPTRHKIDDVTDALHAVTYLPGELDAPGWIDDEAPRVEASELVAFANGLLHVPTRKLLEHTPRLWVHHALPFAFDPDAGEPVRWRAFLHDLFEDDDEATGTLQEVFGYLLGGGTRLQKIVLIAGPKRSGKGTIGRVLTGLLGKHNVAAPTFASLATNFGLSALIDRPLAIVSDARLSKRADQSVVVERLLSVSGEDSLTIDRKYRDPWTGRLPSRFVILSNELPKLTDSSGALASRFVLFTLTATFYGRENPALTDELLAEAPAIMNWSLEGLDRLNDRGYFVQPASSAEALQQLEDLASPVGAFVRDRCRVDDAASVAVDDLWRGWRSWCDDQGAKPGTKNMLGRDLRAAVPRVKKERPREDGQRRWWYRGIGLADGAAR
jgi:putative DNA primase/helicase